MRGARNNVGALQGCAGIAAVVLPSVGLDCASVKQAVQRVEDAAAARSKDAARVSLLHMAVRSRSVALVRPARVVCTGCMMGSTLALAGGTFCMAHAGFPGCWRTLSRNLSCSVSSGLQKRAALACLKHLPVCARLNPRQPQALLCNLNRWSCW